MNDSEAAYSLGVRVAVSLFRERCETVLAEPSTDPADDAEYQAFLGDLDAYEAACRDYDLATRPSR